MRHLKIYRAIRSIYRNGSIRKAAEQLAVSPSALNRSIQAFEDELGVPVFDRVTGGVELTAAGELLLNVINRHLTEFDEMQSQMRSLQGGITGSVRISLGEDISTGLLLRSVAEFETEFPGVSVEILHDNSIEGLKNRTVDLAIMTNPATDDAVEVRFTRTVDLTAWGGADDRPASGIWDLVEERLILPPQGTGTRTVFSHLMRRHRLSERSVTTVSADKMLPLLLAGNRACVAPAVAFDFGALPAKALRHSLDLGQVEVAVLRASDIPATRTVEALSMRLQGALERLAQNTAY
ncbi:MAG: LysR family transcriptional regulator [Alphaproteobacteria bacterium]